MRYYGDEEFPVFQVVWPSAFDGCYPWDLDADPAFVAIQPVLGKAEQGGNGQPSTRPKSKPEGSDKPQPEADGRSQ